MSNLKKVEIERTPELIAKVQRVIEEGRKHVYSVSRVFAAHNEAMGLSETPQSCSSCLRTRVAALTQWMEDAPKESEEGKTGAPVKDENGYNPLTGDAFRLNMGEGVTPFDFIPGDGDDISKGKVVQADGSAVKAGTYVATTGETIKVQPGGKASITVVAAPPKIAKPAALPTPEKPTVRDLEAQAETDANAATTETPGTEGATAVPGAEFI